jgi:hypothetical protein
MFACRNKEEEEEKKSELSNEMMSPVCLRSMRHNV